MKKIALIVHGQKAGADGVPEGIDALRADGHEIDVSATKAPGDAIRLTEDALRRAGAGEVDTLVVGGGDGTVNEVLAAVAETPAPPGLSIGILPLGTANDFARCADIPVGDPAAALRLIADTTARPIDLGRIDDRVFVNTATGGFGARVTVETPDDLKQRLGGLAYVLTGLQRAGELASHAGTFRGEGFSWSGPFVAMAIGNGRYAGGGVPLCPDAVLDDGYLDLTIVRALSAEAPPEIDVDPETDAVDIGPLRVTARSEWFAFEGDEELCLNLDGEPTSLTRFEARCLPRPIRLHVGPAAPLVTRD